MRLLDRYLLRELLVPFAVCLGGFLIFWISFDLTTSLNRYQEKRLVFSEIAALYLAKLPQILVLILPIVLLLAMLYTLTYLARHHELTAIRAAGISLFRICVPYFAVGLALGGASFLMNEYWVPGSADRENEIMSRHETDHAGAGRADAITGFVNTRDHEVWNFTSYNPETFTLAQPRVGWTTANGDSFRALAGRADYVNGVWTFYDVGKLFRNEVPVPVTNNTVAVPELSETPDQIRREVKFLSQTQNLAGQQVEVSAWEILDYLDLHPTGLSTRARLGWLTQLHGRIAEPWTCLIVVLIAIPFGAASGRRNLFVGVASSIVICFVYYVLLKLGLALGSSGYLPPWFAAWFPNIAFGVAAISMMLRVR